MRETPTRERAPALSGVRRQGINRELVRSGQFLLVSLASATSNLLYIAALSRLTTLPFWLISLTSTEFSMLVNFALNDRFTFRNLGSNRPWYVRLGRFQIAAIGGNLLTAAIATLLHTDARVSPVVAQTIAIIVTFFANFVAHRFWTFRASTPAATATPAARAMDTGAHATSPFWPPEGLTGVSVIIPARNERPTLGALLQLLDAAMSGAGIPYEALVVDDYSSDDSAQVAEAVIAERRLPARVLSNQGKQGKSYALMLGFAAARYPALAMIDADLELPPESLPPMARRLEHSEIVVGRRLGYSDGNLLRGQLSAAFNKLVARLFLGITVEAQTGIKVFWKRAYQSVDLAPGKWGFDIEFIAKALAKGFRVDEIETPFQKRRAGNTNVNPLAVAGELLFSAARIKLDILRAVKASAALREPAEPASGPVPLTARLRDGFPGLLHWVAPLALLYVFLRAVMGPAFFSSTQYVGSRLDTGQDMWYIGWIWWALEHGRNPFITAAFSYPTPTFIMDYTSVPALGLLFGWLCSLVGVIFTYNLIIIVNYVLIFIFSKLTLGAVGVNQTLSSVGGLLFCLLPYLTEQSLQHLNLVFVAPLFIAGYLVVRLARAEERPGLRYGLLIGSALLLAFYVYLETFLTLTLCVLVVCACGMFCARATTARLLARLAHPPFLVGLGVPVFWTIPGLLNFLQGQETRPFDLISAGPYSNDLFSLVLPTKYYLLHTSATVAFTSQLAGYPPDVNGYLGVPLILFAIAFAVRYWRNDTVRTLAHAALLMLLFSLGAFLGIGGVKTYAPLPWLFVLPFHLPFLHNAYPARLGLYTQYLALALVILGADLTLRRALLDLRQARRRAKPWVGLSLSVASLVLVALFWFPTIPFPTDAMPPAVGILRAGHVVPRYIQRKPTLVLHEDETGFNVVMGILAESNDYDLVTSNIYGYAMSNTPSLNINLAFTRDTDGIETRSALQRYLPPMGVSRVMFVSTDSSSLGSLRLNEISSYLGPPLYNNQGLVVIWDATAATSAISATAAS